MPRTEDIMHSVLIVSGSEKFYAAIKKVLPEMRLTSVEFRKYASAARRCILERYYDIVVINAPLPDETGAELALDTVEDSNISVLMITGPDMYENLSEDMAAHGIPMLARPVTLGSMARSMKLLLSFQEKIRRMEQQLISAREKTEELHIIDKAKFLLVENRHMTENEAHRFIGREAMNHGVSRRRIAEEIIDEME